MRAQIAMVMAVVAMLGAVAAFRTAFAEQETSRLERTLDQGHMLELASRQGYLDKTSINARLNDHYNQHHNLGAYLQKVADGIRAADTKKIGEAERLRAARLDLKAQEEFAAARVFVPARDYLSVDMNNDLPLEAAVEKLATADLGDYGFDVHWPEKADADGNFPSIWEALENEIKIHEKRVVQLAEAAAIFVFSLAFFTFAQLSPSKSRREKGCEIFGFALGVFALVFALIVDRGAWKYFAVFGAIFSVVGCIGWKLSGRMKFLHKEHKKGKERNEHEEEEPCHPGEVDPLVFAGVRLHGSETKDSFARVTIILIAFTAIFSALSALYYSSTSTAANKASSEALQHQVELFKSSSRPATSAYYVLGVMATAQEYRSRLQAARQRLQLAEDGLPLAAAGDPAEDIKIIAGMMKEQSKGHNMQEWLAGEEGPDLDPRFPERFLTRTTARQYHEDFGMWDAKNELSLGWRKEANIMLATITLFAIALYLFGQSLGMGRTRAAFILVFLSSCLVLIGAGQAMVVRFTPLPGRMHTLAAECKDPEQKINQVDPAEDAAKHYAAGMRKYAGAHVEEEFAEAAREFKCAVDSRPTFALANYELSHAMWQASTPQKGEAYVSLTSKDALPSIIAYQDAALAALDQEGLARPLTMLGNHGFDNVLLALAQHDRKYLQHGIEATQTALSKNDKSQSLRFNLGMSLLASGKKDEGIQQYDLGLKQPVGRNLAAGSMTDLNILLKHCTSVNTQSYCTDLAGDVARLKASFVASTWPGPEQKAASFSLDPAQISGVELVASPAGVGWHARVQNLNLKRDVLTVLWYAHDDPWDVWRMVPGVTGKVGADSLVEESDGRSFMFNSFLDGTSAHRCLPEGKYRAEFYLNDRLVADQVLTLVTSPFEAAAYRDMDIAMCHPQDWERWAPKEGDPGLVRGFRDKHRDRGAFVFTYYYPKTGTEAEARSKFLLKSVKAVLGKDISTISGVPEEPAACPAFPEGSSVLRRRYVINGATIMARSWVQPDGTVHVGIVYRLAGVVDPANRHTTEMEDCGTLLSFTTVY